VFIDILPTNKTFHTLGLLDSNNNIITEILIGRAYNTEPVNLAIDGAGVLQFQSVNLGDPIPVNTVQELVLINTNLDGEYLQTSAINMLGPLGGMNPGLVHNWTPIGTDAAKFTGTFDGGGKEITNLYIDRQSESYIGLFGYIDGAELANIVLKSGSVTGKQYVGGIAGYANTGSEISDCSNAAEIAATHTTYGYAGGIAGQSKGASGSGNIINHCSNTGAVSGKQYLGGIAGYIDQTTIEDCHNTAAVVSTSTGTSNAGGIAGQSKNNSAINQCSNDGGVSGATNIGGIAGNINQTSIDDCRNTGTVSAVGNNPSNTGGIAGVISNGAATTRCSNGGIITGKINVGGIAGKNDKGTITACYNTGTVSATNNPVGGIAGFIENAPTIIACYNTGAVTGSQNAGGIVGNANGGTITACYNTGAITAATRPGGIMGNSSATIAACYWLSTAGGDAVNGIGSPSSDSGAAFFTSAASFPGVRTVNPAWGTGSGGQNEWWKTGTTDGGQLPQLWWEP
jgi:hypothetical protein